MHGTYMAVVDADRIQEYIFAPRQLKLIRGASAIQRDVNLIGTLELLRDPVYGAGNIECNAILDSSLDQHPAQMWEVFYAGGGNVYALFRDGAAALRFTDAARALYRKNGASATGAVVAWVESFDRTLDYAQAELVARKTSCASPSQALSNPYFKTCEACGLASAACWKRNAVTGERLVCPTCESRRAASNGLSLLKEIAPHLIPPKDFDSIAEKSRPDGYLGMVYVDVDRLGRYFEEKKPLTAAKYRSESLRIRDAIKYSVFAGCRAASEACGESSTAPFEVLLLGGDDAIVMLASQAVFPFLRRFREEFHTGIADLSFSAGVVWAHRQLPIAQYIHHAKKLLRNAKADGGARIDYLIVSESMVRERTGNGAETHRPYSFESFEKLVETVGAWKKTGFPSSKAHQLYAMAFEERTQATLDFLYWTSRLELHHREQARLFFAEGFWKFEQRHATAGADLAELWDFVEAA